MTRAIQTLLIAAEEGKRLVGEVVPIEAAPGNAHRMGFTIRVPRGVVCGITSFNAPLNFVAHKVAPALAAGNTVVLKAPQATPFSAAAAVEILLEAGFPPAHVNLVQGPGSDVGRWLVENQSIRFFTFTGSTARRQAAAAGASGCGRSRSNSAASPPPSSAPTPISTGRCRASSTRHSAAPDRPARPRSGCSCSGRCSTDSSRALAAATAQVKVGDPRDPQTVVGPMISEAEAARAEQWVAEAVAAGARLVAGGSRRGAVLDPTILTDVRPDMRVLCEEIFAPVMSIVPFDTLDEAIAAVNATPFGLAAGIFTRDITTALHRRAGGSTSASSTSTSRRAAAST